MFSDNALAINYLCQLLFFNDNDDNNNDDNNNKDGNDDKGISALGLDRHGVFMWMTLVAFLIFLYRITKNLPNQTSHNLLKILIFANFGHNSSLGLNRDLGFSRG